MTHTAFEKYIEMSKNPNQIRKLETILSKVNSNMDFNLLQPGDHFFITKMYIGKTAQIIDDKDGYEHRISHLLDRRGINLEDYSNNDYSTVAKNIESAAKTVIRAYKNFNRRSTKGKDDDK